MLQLRLHCPYNVSKMVHFYRIPDIRTPETLRLDKLSFIRVIMPSIVMLGKCIIS